MQASLYFHDYETWGTNPALDRPSQFAGIRTDLELNIIGEPDMFFCKVPDDYLPNPEAALITGITPQQADRDGVVEAEFARRIHQVFSQPGTCILGYNNVRFDDEVTRNIFYRNFYDPYAHTWRDGNSRWDILDMMRACYALRPDGIEWPVDDEGLPSFRLEKLTEANGIEHANAHDAMADVYATIEMARLVRTHQPKLFNYLFQLRGKRKVQELIDVVAMQPLVHVSGMFGAARGCTSWVAPLAWHPDNNNAVIMYDLTIDPAPMLELSADDLRERLYTPKAELGDLPQVGLKLVHTNKCPILAPAKTLLPENAERLNIDREACLENLALLRKHPEIREKAAAIFAEQREFEASDNVDAQLYQGFFSNADREAMSKIPGQPAEALGDFNWPVADPRFEQLLFRYRARNYPHSLASGELQRWREFCRESLSNQSARFEQQLYDLMTIHGDNERKARILKAVYDHAVQKLGG